MGKIFILRIEDDDFSALREKYGKCIPGNCKNLQGTEDEQALKDFMQENDVGDVQVWQVRYGNGGRLGFPDGGPLSPSILPRRSYAMGPRM